MDDPRPPNQRLAEVLRRAQEGHDRTIAALRRSEAILRRAHQTLAEARAVQARTALADDDPPFQDRPQGD
jgi:hypothetical protein